MSRWHLGAVSDYSVWDLHFEHCLRAARCLLNCHAGKATLLAELPSLFPWDGKGPELLQPPPDPSPALPSAAPEPPSNGDTKTPLLGYETANMKKPSAIVAVVAVVVVVGGELVVVVLLCDFFFFIYFFPHCLLCHSAYASWHSSMNSYLRQEKMPSAILSRLQTVPGSGGWKGIAIRHRIPLPPKIRVPAVSCR